MEVRNRFKGLDLRDRVPEELWMEVHDIIQDADHQDNPQEKEMQKGKWLSEEALQIAVKRREVKGKGEKETYTHLNAEFQRRARRETRMPSSVINGKKWKTIEWERLEISSRKFQITRELFMQRRAQ